MTSGPRYLGGLESSIQVFWVCTMTGICTLNGDDMNSPHCGASEIRVAFRMVPPSARFLPLPSVLRFDDFLLRE